MAVMVFVLIISGVGVVNAVEGFDGKKNVISSSIHQYRPGSGEIYSQSDLNTYWPALGDRESCEARKDLVLQVTPAGCTPSVVRSDLLAERNVPVFCQVNALQSNPLLDIKEVRNIRFRGDLPNEVAGTGFHPARAALRSRDALLGDPLINNVGYVVVILKKQPIEKELPDSVKLTLSAQVDYESGKNWGDIYD